MANLWSSAQLIEHIGCSGHYVGRHKRIAVVPAPATTPSVTLGVNQEVIMSHIMKVLRTAICIGSIIVGLFVLPNNPALAADGTLTNPHAKQLISEVFNKQPDKLDVIGVFEQQNIAQADVVITNLLVSRPKNDAVTAYAFGPGGGTNLWSGRATANFKRYNDGRWVLVSVETEIGKFSPMASQAPALQPQIESKPKPPITSSKLVEVVVDGCKTFMSESAIASGGTCKWKGSCKDGYEEGPGVRSCFSPGSARPFSVMRGIKARGKFTSGPSESVAVKDNGQLLYCCTPGMGPTIITVDGLPDWARELAN